jgi:hypothetical protein
MTLADGGTGDSGPLAGSTRTGRARGEGRQPVNYWLTFVSRDGFLGYRHTGRLRNRPVVTREPIVALSRKSARLPHQFSQFAIRRLDWPARMTASIACRSGLPRTAEISRPDWTTASDASPFRRQAERSSVTRKSIAAVSFSPWAETWRLTCLDVHADTVGEPAATAVSTTTTQQMHSRASRAARIIPLVDRSPLCRL